MKRGRIHRREAFLNQVAERLGRKAYATNVQAPQWRHQPQWTVFQGYSEDDLLEVLKTQCASIHTDVFETNKEQLPLTLQKVVSHYGGGPVVTWNDPRFAEYGLSHLLYHHWRNSGIHVHIWDPSLGAVNITEAEQANIGITFSDITLAESGTVVLFSDRGKGRTVSFLPQNYICIIPKSTIVPRMTQAAFYIHQQVKAGKEVASCINFITGPSNSADIEMNLVVGVHGPVKAAYVVVADG